MVLLAAGAVAFSTVTTASARFAASTSNESSLFAAAEIDLVVDNGDGAAARLLVDADGLYPGLVVERCLVVTHRGSLEGVDVRLHVAPGSDTGLARFLRTEVELGEGVDAECGDFEAAESQFSGTLSELLADHGSFPQGIDLMSDAGDEQSITLRVSFEVESDDRAQGLSTDFMATLEARP